jgi:hypothetical protein
MPVTGAGTVLGLFTGHRGELGIVTQGDGCDNGDVDG